MDAHPENPQPEYLVKQNSPETEGAATTALWLEIIFGFFSLLGVGHVYAGRTWLGIVLMIGWWLYIAIAGMLSIITFGLGACLFVPVYFVVPIISGIQARTYMQKESGKGSWGAVALVAGGGCILTIIVVVILAAVGIFAAVVSQNYPQ
jgi:hypothetical protein